MKTNNLTQMLESYNANPKLIINKYKGCNNKTNLKMHKVLKSIIDKVGENAKIVLWLDTYKYFVSFPMVFKEGEVHITQKLHLFAHLMEEAYGKECLTFAIYVRKEKYLILLKTYNNLLEIEEYDNTDYEDYINWILYEKWFKVTTINTYDYDIT